MASLRNRDPIESRDGRESAESRVSVLHISTKSEVRKFRNPRLRIRVLAGSSGYGIRPGEFVRLSKWRVGWILLDAEREKRIDLSESLLEYGRANFLVDRTDI